MWWSVFTAVTALAGELFLTSLVGVVGSFAVVRVLIGLGEATAPPNGNLGGAISPTLTPFLAQSMGWEGALYTTAALAGCGAFFWLWVHPEHEIDLEGVPSKQLPVTQTIGVEGGGSWSMTSSEQRVVDALEELGLPFERIRIDPAHADTAVFCEKYGYPPETSGNTIIVASKKEPKKFVACVVLATTQLDVNKRVRKLMGASKASFASAEEMNALTGMEVGGVTPFALPADMPLYVDTRVMGLETIILGGGGRGLKIGISPQVFHKLGAEVVADLGIRPHTGATGATGAKP